MKKLAFRMAALAVILAGVTACASKEKAESTEEQDQTAQQIEDNLNVQPEADPIAEPEPDSDEDDMGTTYIATHSGLKYRVIKEGNGRSPKATDVVEVNYEGRLLDGTVFDSSYDRGQSIEFPLNGVIKGWTEGLQLMKEGGKFTFFIPSDLAYGPNGIPNAIPPHSTLIFDVELINVKKK